MNQRSFSLFAGIIFTSIALLHLLRSFTTGIPLSKAGLYRLVNAGDKHQEGKGADTNVTPVLP
jgi:hypothetical protein